jgi:hypothetical protein
LNLGLREPAHAWRAFPSIPADVKRAGTLLAMGAAIFVLLPGSASAEIPHLPWTTLLPPLPSSSDVQPGPVENCRRGRIACVDGVIRRLRKLRNRLGCDHRGVFATTYLELTRQIRQDLDDYPDLYRDRRYLYFQDALFANVYLDTYRAYRRGKPVPGAWRIAFETAASSDVNAAQDMLLGINAHVQNDMPFVVAALGLREPDGTSRKPDHDAGNEVLNRGYQRVVDAVEDRYDPLVGWTNSDLTPLDDFAGLQLTQGWREIVWRNAERLLNASSDSERAQVASSIESHATGWAQGIAAIEQPGYRPTRDAYCEAQLRR